MDEALAQSLETFGRTLDLWISVGLLGAAYLEEFRFNDGFCTCPSCTLANNGAGPCSSCSLARSEGPCEGPSACTNCTLANMRNNSKLVIRISKQSKKFFEIFQNFSFSSAENGPKYR